jgi:hypothetical protein
MARKPAADTTPDVEPTDEELVAATEVQDGTDTEADETIPAQDAPGEVTATEGEHIVNAAPAVTPAEIDLTAFNEAIASVIWPQGNDDDKEIQASESANEAAGGEPDDEGKAAVLEAYTGLEGAASKREARNVLQSITTQNMDADLFFTAKKSMLLADHIVKAKAAKTPAAPKAPVNPTEGFIDHLASLNLAFQFAASQTPENVDADWQTKYQAKVDEISPAFLQVVATEDRTTENPIFAASLKLGARKVTKARVSGSSSPREGVYSGPPRSILKHITEAFAGQPSGTFLKINEISKFESSEYGSDHPSPGAISGRINQANFGEQTGLEAVVVPGEPKGVRKP